MEKVGFKYDRYIGAINTKGTKKIARNSGLLQ